MNWQPKHPAVAQLIQAIRAETTECYLVGGAVRDLLLGTDAQTKDFDFVVAEPALAIARRVADQLGWVYYPLDETREVARVLFAGGQSASHPQHAIVCDIVRMRGESIESDLRARDFTVNALALGWRNAETYLIDVCGGEQDLRHKVVRRVSPVSLAEDAIRILRAPRFMAQLNFSLDSETEAQIVRLARTLQLAGPERVRDELWKCMHTPHPTVALYAMRRLGLLPHILPELAATVGVAQSAPHHEDVFEHTVRTVAHAAELRAWLLSEGKNAPAPSTWIQNNLGKWRFRLRPLFGESVAADRTRADWLVWHALLHDIGKPPTQARDANDPRRIRFFRHEDVGARLTELRLAHLRFSRNEISLARQTVAGHMRPHHLHASFPTGEISRRAIFRFYRDTAVKPARQIAAFDILLLALCDQQAIFGVAEAPEQSTGLSQDKSPVVDQTASRHIQELMAFGFEQLDQTDARHTPLLDGRTLMRHFKVPPGPHLGSVLSEIQEAQAAGEVSTLEEALRLAETLLTPLVEQLSSTHAQLGEANPARARRASSPFTPGVSA